MGFPPELLGLSVLTEEDIEVIRRIHFNFEDTLSTALSYYNPRSRDLVGIDIEDKIAMLDVEVAPHKQHLELTNSIIDCVKKNQLEPVPSLCIQAAHIRKFLG
jgi:phosphoenolpyruvate carboxylase